MAAYLQIQLSLDFYMEANNINPAQTAPKETVLSGLIFIAIWATLLHDQMREQITKFVARGLRV